jgi:catechol 2,3-dioxygenase-like lactoylglutathione lyase family enzyme
MSSTKQRVAHSLHHINFPITDAVATADWYGKVFGMEPIDVSQITPDTKTLLLTMGNFDLHFHPVPADEFPRTRHHFAVEVEDWDGFLEHLKEINVPHSAVTERPTNNSKTAVLRDPDGTHVEIVWHGDRDW